METPSSATPIFCNEIGCWGLILFIFLILRRKKVNKKGVKRVTSFYFYGVKMVPIPSHVL